MTIEDYITATRLPLDEQKIDWDFVSYYKDLYQEVLSGFKEESTFDPNLIVLRSLNKNTQLISINNTSHLIYDQYLGQSISELTRIYCCASTPDDAKAFMFRVAAETAECCGNPDLALWFACLYSHVFHLSHEYKTCESAEQRQIRYMMTAIGESYILAHERAHHLWREGLFHPTFVDFLTSDLEDTSELSEARLDKMVEAHLDDLSFQYHGEAIPHAANIKTDEERARDVILRRELREDFRRNHARTTERNTALAANPLFREEVLADFVAVRLCVEAYAEKADVETVMTAIQLVTENLTTIAQIVEHTEKMMGFETFDHVDLLATRKRVVRGYLECEYDREQESRHVKTDVVTARTGHEITTEVNVRYMRFVRDPITLDVASRFSDAFVLKPETLQRFRHMLNERYGREMTSQVMIKAKCFRLGGADES